MDELIEILAPFVRNSREVITREDAITSGALSTSEKRKAQEEIYKLNQKFSEDGTKLVNGALREFDRSSGPESLSETLERVLENLRKLVAEDPSGQKDEILDRSVSRTSDRLLEIARRQQKKSPLRRKVEILSPFIFLFLAGAVALGVRYYSAVPTFAKIETREQLVDAYDVVKKADRYDNFMNTHVQRGGWIKTFLFWPIEPTEEEIKFAGKMVVLVDTVHDYAQNKKMICDDSIRNLEAATSDQKISYTEMVGKYAKTYTGKGSAIEIAFDALQEKFPCK